MLRICKALTFVFFAVLLSVLPMVGAQAQTVPICPPGNSIPECNPKDPNMDVYPDPPQGWSENPTPAQPEPAPPAPIPEEPGEINTVPDMPPYVDDEPRFISDDSSSTDCGTGGTNLMLVIFIGILVLVIVVAIVLMLQIRDRLRELSLK